MMNTINYSIVIPCYASGLWLPELVQRIAEVMKSYGIFEVIFVNDRSPDKRTWDTIVQLSEKYDFVQGIDLLYNIGQFRATLCGLEHAQGRYVITMDDDLQHPPEELPKLIKAMDSSPDMDCIMGAYNIKKHTFIRNSGSKFLAFVMDKMYNKPRGISTTSFRIMPAEFAKILTLYRIAYPLLGPLIVSVTKKVMNVSVEHHVRNYGQSGYSIRRCVYATFHSIINASILPLRWFSAIGFSTAGFAFILSLWYWMCWMFGGSSVKGFTSLILTISFFSGMILAGIGLLGEYIGRIISEITGLPRYEVRSIVGRGR
ncbi:glycosyltransferase [Desulforhopalus vacuolatus]|uniref:glycosyltransferase n=1 Tax=Desulforhopalus vacuolatus TaxID=40414 RepID=UPI001963F9F3|nr:glycosyltransferase [Desulforhopalus vacuolatus]MBM9520042.1 glycosyltransferase [Desulforhopalus vacuolatus]